MQADLQDRHRQVALRSLYWLSGLAVQCLWGTAQHDLKGLTDSPNTILYCKIFELCGLGPAAYQPCACRLKQVTFGAASNCSTLSQQLFCSSGLQSQQKWQVVHAEALVS